jgi:MiaB-like tRNA modifying enzyme
MVQNLQDFQTTDKEELANIVVINSCTVTNSADSTARNYINQIKKLPNNPKIFFTGCAVRTKGEELYKAKKIDSLFGHSSKENINTLLKKNERFFDIGNLEHLDNTIVEKLEGRSRAFVKIQEGCDFRCGYCIIPYVRGDARSYKDEYILKQISILASNGFSEFILTGTNIGSFGKEKSLYSGLKQKDKLANILKQISFIRGVKRIRLGSIEPVQITDEFKEILGESWMAKHLHIALQHTSEKILSLMNRRNSFRDDIELLNEISSYGYALGSDYIVGHPGEDEVAWSEAIDRVKELPLTHIHAFTYSKRDGTPSAIMKDYVRGDIAKLRHKELTAIIKEKNLQFRKDRSSNLEVLVENGKNGLYNGYDQYFNRIEIQSSEDLSGNWISVDNVIVKGDKNVAIFK